MKSMFNRQRVPSLIYQSESAECGLACIAMIANHLGHEIDLRTLRNSYPASARGATLNDLVTLGAELQLAARPVAAELQELSRLQLPAILHWDFNHFVVLAEVRKGRCVILDPAVGRRTFTLAELSPHFTGVAVEFSRTEQFTRKQELSPTSFSMLIGEKAIFVRPVVHALVLALIIQLLSLALPLGLQLAIDNAAVSGDRPMLHVIGFAVLGLVLVQSACWIARGLVLSYLGGVLHYKMMQNLFRHLLRLPMAFFERRSLADIISRFDSLRNIQRTLSQSFLEAAVDGVFAVVTVAVLLRYNATLTLFVLGGMSLYIAGRYVIYTGAHDSTQEGMVRTAKYQAHIMETIRGISTVKLFNRQYLREARWQSLVVSAFGANHSVNSWTAAATALATVISGVLWVSVIWLGGMAVLDGTMSAGMVFAYAAWQMQFVARLILLVDKSFEFQMLKLHRARVADIATTAPEEPELRGAVPVDTIKGEIELRNVSYQFDRTGPFVIRDLSLKIAPGESVAIVGSSGEGKTTLLKLMLGLLEPTSGEVLVDGIPIKKMGLQAYREFVGVVLQDDALFAGSIGENISFFDARPDMRRVQECAAMAAVHNDIAAMPMGYQTLVGDMGSALSGGQKQRILMARALYRQPVLLFLDEATSHLDVARERQVNEAVAALGITRVIIAHRTETIASATRVVTLRRGSISSDRYNVAPDGAPAAPLAEVDAA